MKRYVVDHRGHPPLGYFGPPGSGVFTRIVEAGSPSAAIAKVCQRWPDAFGIRVRPS